jgi:large subunit ribosomal protein L21
MYAVIQDRGKQYTVRAGDRLRVDRLEAEAGSEVVFDRVLLTGGDAGVQVGRPVVEGVAVRAKVVAERKEAKIIVFKKKRRKRMRRKQGHRQRMTEIHVVSIG